MVQVKTWNYGYLGEEVVGQGKYGTDFYMIISGQAEVTQRAGEIGETVSVGQLGPRYVWVRFLKFKKSPHVLI